jgi:plasmid maintenance system antidote protein VapI
MGRKKAPPTLAEIILKTIHDRQLTAYRLEQMTGVKATVIQRFLNGERGVNLKTAGKLCEALGLTLVEIKPPAE